MSGPVEIVLIIAAVGYVLARRLMGEPAVGKRLLVLPVVLGLIGLTQVTQVTSAVIVSLVASALLSVVFGVLRGVSVRTYEQNGLVMVRYTVTTIALWVLSIAARFALGFLIGSSTTGLMFVVGAGLLAEGLVVMWKAMRVQGQIVWSKGRQGAPHRTSPMLDEWQQKVQGSRVRRHDSR